MDTLNYDLLQPSSTASSQLATIQSVNSASNISSSTKSPLTPSDLPLQVVSSEELVETSLIRRPEGCIRCINQESRCVRDPNNPEGECLTCKCVSEPRLLHCPCLRKGLTDTSFVTAKSDPGLYWTRRWTSLDVVDIENWASPEVKMIELTQTNSSLKWPFRARKFVPQEGNSLERTWLSNSTGNRRYHPVTPYGLLSMKESGNCFSRSLENDMDTIIDEIVGLEKTWLAETYRMAYKHSKESESHEERELLKDTLKLRGMSLVQSRSERISGVETIGIEPQLQDADRHDYGHVPVPPVISAQITIIAETLFFKPLQIQIRNRLDKLIGTKKPEAWFTIHLVCILLLHNCALITGYNFRKAKNLRLSQRYAAADVLSDLHGSANILLTYYHCCIKGNVPFATGWKSPQDIERARLSKEQVDFLVWSHQQSRIMAPLFQQLREDNVFHHEFYFISQLFDDQWTIPTATIASVQK